MKAMFCLISKCNILIGKIISSIRQAGNHFVRVYVTSRFSKVGKHVYVGHDGIFTFENIELGDDIYIGPKCVFQSSYGRIVIHDHCMFGPGVNIHGGDHRTNEVGCIMKHTTEKNYGDDGTVTIEDDCWIGANSVILSNVTIGRGSIIGDGALVRMDVPPHSIYTENYPKMFTKCF